MGTDSVTQVFSDEYDTAFSLYIDSLKASTSKRSMSQILHKIADYLSDQKCDAEDYAWHKLDKDDVGAAKDWMIEHYAPGTVNRGLSAIRGVLAMAARSGKMNMMDEMLIVSNLPNVQNHPEPAGRLIEDSEIRKLFSVCKNDSSAASGARDYAMFSLMYATGARRSELVHLNVADFDEKAQSLSFRETKGWKDRTVFIGNDVVSVLHEWLSFLSGHTGPLFRRILKGDSVTGQRLTDQGLYTILLDRAAQARVDKLTPHDFRRTFISKMIDKGVDLVTVANIVGHDNVKQTMDYDRRGLVPAMAATLALP